jgi:hypothetical protein
MQTRTKSTFLLLAVLLLGILIGILLSGVLVNRRMDRLARMRTGPGIAFFIEDAVRPQSDEQRARIREVLDAAAPRFAEVFDQTREELDALSDSVMLELSGVLSEDQMEELRRHLEGRKRRMPRRGRDGEWRRGPPPPPAGSEGRPPGSPPPDGRRPRADPGARP